PERCVLSMLAKEEVGINAQRLSRKGTLHRVRPMFTERVFWRLAAGKIAQGVAEITKERTSSDELHKADARRGCARLERDRAPQRARHADIVWFVADKLATEMVAHVVGQKALQLHEPA